MSPSKDFCQSGDSTGKAKNIFCNNIPQKQNTEKHQPLVRVSPVRGEGPGPSLSGQLGQAEQYQQRNTECGAGPAAVTHPGGHRYWPRTQAGLLFIKELTSVNCINNNTMNPCKIECSQGCFLLNEARNPIDGSSLCCYEYVYENRLLRRERVS